MDSDGPQLDPFDRKLIALKSLGAQLDPAIDVHNMLQLAWASAQTVFGAAARPEQSVAICELIMQARELQNQR